MDASPSSHSQQSTESRPTFSYDADSASEPVADAIPDSSGTSAAAELAQRGTGMPQLGSQAVMPRLPSSTPAAEQRSETHSAMPRLGGAETARPDYGGRLRARSGMVEGQASPGATDPTVPGNMANAQLSALRREALDRAKVTHHPERVKEWLLKKGVDEPQAQAMSDTAWRQAQNYRKSETARRANVARQQRGENVLAALEIIAGFVLLGVGLAMGWFVGLFLVPIIDGFRRLG